MSSYGYRREDAISQPASPVDAADLLAKIKADFVDCRLILLKVIRSRAPYRSTITGNHSNLRDGSKGLEDTLSSIIANLSDLTGERGIPMVGSDGMRDLRHIEVSLRGNVVDELMDADERREPDYDRLSRKVTTLYNELVGVIRG